MSVEALNQQVAQSPLYTSNTYHIFSRSKKHLFKTYEQITSMFTVTTSPENDMHPFTGLTLYTPNVPGLTIENGNMYFELVDWKLPTTYTITVSGW